MYFISEYEWIFETKIGDIEFCLNQCCRCYEEGLRAVESTMEDNKLEMRSSLKKRLANIKNELGVWYMNKAQAGLQNDGRMCVMIKKTKKIILLPKIKITFNQGFFSWLKNCFSMISHNCIVEEQFYTVRFIFSLDWPWTIILEEQFHKSITCIW